MSKNITTPIYHIWTDALHFRALASQTYNKDWNRGTYIRWGIISAWTAFEMACQDAVGFDRLGNRFKDKLNYALKENNCDQPNWGEGIWQKVGKVYELRKSLVHSPSREDLRPTSVERLDEAIEILRDAITEIYLLAKSDPPRWQLDDKDEGWVNQHDYVNVTVLRGVDHKDTRRIEVVYISKGKECLSEVLPPDSDYKAAIESIKMNALCSISAFRVYQGDGELIYEEEASIRGV
ncbi:MAG: hypothetical protein ABQ298_02385 [Puniceicoccaceae bacterium]